MVSFVVPMANGSVFAGLQLHPPWLMGPVGLHDHNPGMIDLRGFPSKGFTVRVRWKATP
jgi:hypothetical protein